LDLLIAAHVLLLIIPPLPDTFVKELTQNTLADHAKRIQTIVLGSDQPKLHTRSWRNSICNLVPSYRVVKTITARERAPEDVKHEKLTWGFFGLALGSVAAYFAVMGFPIIVARSVLEDEEDEEEDEEEIDEDEGDKELD